MLAYFMSFCHTGMTLYYLCIYLAECLSKYLVRPKIVQPTTSRFFNQCIFFRFLTGTCGFTFIQQDLSVFNYFVLWRPCTAASTHPQLSASLLGLGGCILDVLWGQPIKIIQVASTSELLGNQWIDLVFFKIIPSHFCRASEASKIDCFEN